MRWCMRANAFKQIGPQKNGGFMKIYKAYQKGRYHK